MPVRVLSPALALVILAAATLTSAVPITQPPGLAPGTEYRLVFVTSTRRDALSSNIADYNSYVTDLAESVPELLALGTSWRAIASTRHVDARDNTSTNPSEDGPGVPIYNLAGTRIASDYADLWDGTLESAVSWDETGSFPSYSTPWTGSNADGRGDAGNEMGEELTTFGSSNHASLGLWINWATSGSVLLGGVYAMSGTLTVVPEPTTATLLALGLVALAAHRRRL
jgi:hypothetical protein